MKLLIEDDQGNRSVVPVIREEITIGRNEGNTIRLTERNVSRKHARLVRADGRLFVEDVEARYGIKKNGTKIDERAPFDEGDVVVIGDYRLTLRPEQAESASGDGVNGEAAAEISPTLQREEGESGGSPLTAPSDLELDEASAEETTLGDESSAGGETSSRAQTEIIETDPAELVVISSNFAGQNFPLDQEEMVVGRSEDCDIIIDHRSVSSTHAKIVREGREVYKIVDLNSRNGLKVGGEDYKSVHLERGDIVELGHVKFRFVEPGENYVFTPQSGSEEIPLEEAPDEEGINPLALAGVGVAVLAIGAAVVVAMSSGSGQGGEGEEQARAAATAPESSESNEEGGEGRDDRREVDRKIEQAEQSIEAGKLDKAIGSLESIRDLLDPSGEQNDRIDKLLSTAKREQPFRKRYASAKDGLQDDDYSEVLEDLDQLPEHSVFYELAAEQDLRQKALDGLVAEIEEAVDSGDAERAREKAELAMEYDSHAEEVEQTLAELDDTEQEESGEAGERIAANSQAGSQERTGSGGEAPGAGASEPDRAPGSSGGGSDTAPEPDPEPTEAAPSNQGSQNQVTEAEARELYQGAMKKAVRGEHGGAIGDCQKALRANYHPCYRVIGMANKQMGNTAAACKYFGKYLQSDPSNAAKIRDMMDEIDCD